MQGSKHRDFKPIDAAAKDGQPKIVGRGDDLARAKWCGGMWAHDLGDDQDAWHQIDFEPTHYAPVETHNAA